MKQQVIGIAVTFLFSGIFLSLISGLELHYESGFKEIQVDSINGTNRIGVYIAKNIYALFVNVTGNFSQGDFPRLRIYNLNEEVVFSYPITDVSFVGFNVDTKPGLYTIVLEDVIVISSATLGVFGVITVNEAYFPISFLNGIGYFFAGVGIFAFLIGVIFLMRRTNIEDGRIEGIKIGELEKCIHVPRIIVLLYAPICCLGTFLSAYFVSWDFPSSAIPAILGLLYWISIETILRRIARRIGFKRLIFLKGFAIRLGIATLAALSISASLALLSFWLSEISGAITFSLFFATWAMIVITIYFVPFAMAFEGSEKEIAYLAIRQFIYDYEKDQTDADFGLVSLACQNIRDYLISFRIEFSSHSLALGTICDLLRTEKTDKLDAISKALKSFPGSIKKENLLLTLEEIVSLATEMEAKGLKVKVPYSSRLIKSISYIVPVIGATATIIGAFLR